MCLLYVFFFCLRHADASYPLLSSDTAAKPSHASSTALSTTACTSSILPTRYSSCGTDNGSSFSVRIPSRLLIIRCSLLPKNPELCGEITAAVVKTVSVPVTVKIRKGWDDSMPNALEVAEICEQAGAAAITVHGRTRQQYYKPPVDYDIIRQIKQRVRIPVIANGDVNSAQRAKEVLDFTGADFVMVGRATLGNPWIFRQINSYLDNPDMPLYTPTPEEKLDTMVAHVAKMVAYKGEYIALRQARKLVMGYFKGVRGAASLRNEAGTIETMDDLIRLRNKALQAQI